METPIPSEFTAFIHDITTRAFDNLGGRVRSLDAALRGVVRSWAKLSSDDKNRFVAELIAAAQGFSSEPAEEPKTRKPVKRFNPDDVEKTLPKKPKKKASTKAKAKPKRKSS